uniref:Uncharacterized protein n=1 Tax=Anguilla anguilla TaxID=7936 RepID=A0A0E9WBI3_ANGAN
MSWEDLSCICNTMRICMIHANTFSDIFVLVKTSKRFNCWLTC